jgi:hypothetical protein
MKHLYCIERSSTVTHTNSSPALGRWYAGIDRQGHTGNVTQYTDAGFFSPHNDLEVDMSHYAFLRELPDTLGVPKLATGIKQVQAVARALRWLETLLNSPGVNWDAGQREACQEDLDAAKNTLS